MSREARRELRFWQSAAVRLAAIVFVGCAMILWFQGCLVPLTRDDMHREQEKAVGPEALPPKSR